MPVSLLFWRFFEMSIKSDKNIIIDIYKKQAVQYHNL